MEKRLQLMYGLTDDETSVVRSYTGDYYIDINDTWYDDGLDIDILQKDRLTLMYALKKMEYRQIKYDVVYAGLSFGIGPVWNCNRFRSTTTNKNSSFEGLQIKIIKPHGGAMIREFSHYKNEDEYLIPPGKSYEVVDIERNNYDVILTLVEVEPLIDRDNVPYDYDPYEPIEVFGETEWMVDLAYKMDDGLIPTADDLMTTNIHGKTPLHYLLEYDIEKNHKVSTFNAVRDILGDKKLEHIAGMVTRAGETLLSLASKNFNLYIVDFLLPISNVYQHDIYGHSPINHLYLKNIDKMHNKNTDTTIIEIKESLLKKMKMYDVDMSKDIYGRTIKYYTNIKEWNKNNTHKLKLNTKRDYNGDTTLMYKLKNNISVTSKEIKLLGNIGNNAYKYPLTSFTSFIQLERLLKYVEDFDKGMLDGEHESMMHHAATVSVKCVRLLMDYGLNINVVNDYDETPLMFAYLYGNYYTALYLMFYSNSLTSNQSTVWGGDVKELIQEDVLGLFS